MGGTLASSAQRTNVSLVFVASWMSLLCGLFARLPRGVRDKLTLLGLTPDRVHTWSKLAANKADLVGVAFDLDEDKEAADLEEVVAILWAMVQAAAGPDAAHRASRLAQSHSAVWFTDARD